MSVASRTALAAVALLALFTIESAQFECANSTYGQVTDNKEYSPLAILPPGETQFDINLPNTCESGGRVVGSKVKACDTNAAPAVSHRDAQHAVVLRADASGSCTVITVSYCL